VLSNKLRGSQHVLHPVPMRVNQEHTSTKRFFFLKQLKFPEAAKIIAFSRDAQERQTMRM